jgi:hypothetical protein
MTKNNLTGCVKEHIKALVCPTKLNTSIIYCRGKTMERMLNLKERNEIYDQKQKTKVLKLLKQESDKFNEVHEEVYEINIQEAA